MAVIEGISRFLPGVLGNPESLNNESFQGPVLEGPQYTRPAEFRGQAVPPVLLSGDHGAIARWREKQSIEYTRKRRPDLLDAREGDKQS
jgi:tRNA (guanine37-N1)-methyltransferase